MGAAGSPYAAFRRALDRRDLTLAIVEARDLPVVNLADALELLLLIRDQQPDRYERAAARWLGRYILEVPGVDLAEAVLVAGALTALAAPRQRVGALALVALARQRRRRDVERVLRRSLDVGLDDAGSARRPSGGSRRSTRSDERILAASSCGSFTTRPA